MNETEAVGSAALCRFAAAIGTAGIVASPRLAAACPMCLSAAEGTREAYYGTTAFLILLPLLLLGGMIFWLRWMARARERQRGQPSASGPLPRDRASSTSMTGIPSSTG